MEGARSALELLHREGGRRRIVTFCPALDSLLGGGVAPGHVTEFCGVPGMGKTQLGIQLAVDVQIPACFKGLAGQAIYIDTEGSFAVERAVEMADACSAHLRRLAVNSNNPEQMAAAGGFSRETALSGIHYMRVHDATEQLAAVTALPHLLQQLPQVKLVIIDSVTFHFRQGWSQDMPQRTRLLAQMSQGLTALVANLDIAVVMMNQVTIKISKDGSASRLIPALGETWAHAATERVILFWSEGKRSAYLYKSPSLKAGFAQYTIASEGVRGVSASGKRVKVDANDDGRQGSEPQ
eukprot:jgi/Chlat1/8696/Chrsp88S08080